MARKGSNWRKATLALLGLLVLGITAGYFGEDWLTDRFGPAPKYDLSGMVGLLDRDGYSSSGGACAGDGGYSDIEQGLQVVVKNAEGTILGTGHLEPGSVRGGYCVFRFRVNDLPRSRFYAVEAGRRGAITYSFQQLEDEAWSVTLTLG